MAASASQASAASRESDSPSSAVDKQVGRFLGPPGQGVSGFVNMSQPLGSCNCSTGRFGGQILEGVWPQHWMHGNSRQQAGWGPLQQAEHQGSPQLPADLSKGFYSFSDNWIRDIFTPARGAAEGLRWWRTTKRDCKPLGWCLRNFGRPSENLVGEPWALAGSGRRQALGSTGSSSPALSL